MRFSLDLGNDGRFFFDTFSDMTNALQVANVFTPFESDVQYKASAFDVDGSVEFVIAGTKFTDYISFGLNDETRRAYDEFVMERKTPV